MPRADPLPYPVGANERPPFVLERGRQRGGGAFRAPCSVRVIGGLGPKGGGRTFRVPPCVPRLRAEARWRDPCAWRVGAPAGPSGGRAEAGGYAASGGMLAPQTLLHAPVRVFSRKRGRSLPAGGSERRRGGV